MLVASNIDWFRSRGEAYLRERIYVGVSAFSFASFSREIAVSAGENLCFRMWNYLQLSGHQESHRAVCMSVIRH